ncbi:GNAT family N-acetyltransferase [Mesoplasma photuris]|uniref:GNAT family N-acetyltransferase n=1 Tax=Mesoplasma photuris TaxID=217731 RepID=UPI0004E1CA08|nr:GNAT family N-acetyltransferase [Mesoplasma photuris]
MKKRFKFNNDFQKELVNNFAKYFSSPFEEYIESNFDWINDDILKINKINSDSYVVVSLGLEKINVNQISKIISNQNNVSWINFSDNSNCLNHEVLTTNGFEFLHSYQAMILKTQNWSHEDSLNNQRVKVVETKSETDIFKNIINQTFDLETIDLEKYAHINEYNLRNNVNHAILIKDDNDNYVGTGNIYFDSQYAIIDDISVLASARGKGYAKIIMFYLISYAKKIGKESVLLFGTEDGTPVYEKIGFDLIDTYMEVFYKK